jgi:hypothetical protein
MRSQSQVSPSQPSFGILELDSLIQLHGGEQIEKLTPSYVGARAESERLLDGTFLLKCRGAFDAQEIVAKFRQLPYFDYVDLNHLFEIEYFGTQRFVPDTTTKFGDQWNLDTLTTGDRTDIDAPEAWAIEKGDTSIIIGILDTGTMLDTTATPWELHGDLTHHWIAEEDSQSTGVLDGYDVYCGLAYDDNNNDGVRDNIIGHNYTRVFKCRADNDPCPLCLDPAHSDSFVRTITSKPSESS